jgi:predicted dehydrogenase
MKQDESPITRRSFLAGGAVLAGAAGEALAQAKAPAKAPAKPAAKPAAKPVTPAKPAGPPPPTVNCAVIGLGPQGRDILASLSRVPGSNIVSVCDTYQGSFSRAKKVVPNAETVTDYRKILDRKDVPAVFIATGTHQHKQIVTEAIQAGKHVYLEAPLAHTVEEAKAIALAGKGSAQIFQVGLQNRANPQHHHVQKFLHSSVLGTVTRGRGQWHKRQSWRKPAPSNERESQINWHLDEKISPGLIGELGIHSLDTANWFLKATPVSVQGFGSLLVWKEDGRSVPDTVEVVVEYPNGVRFYYDATLTNSYDGQYESFCGTDAAVLLRDQRAWLFKEADAPLLGWEVYARKEEYGDETGICLVADASKQLAEGKIPGKQKQVVDPGKNALFFACEAFLNSIRDPKKKPDCGALQGYQATVTALKANEAVRNGTKIVYQKEWFDLA